MTKDNDPTTPGAPAEPNPYKKHVQRMRDMREAESSTKAEGEKTPVAIETDAFLKATKPAEPKPIYKAFANPIGGEVIMPTGEILRVTVFSSPEVPPTRVGVYLTREDSAIAVGVPLDTPDVGFSHWNGTDWGPQFQTPEAANENRAAAKWPARHWAALVDEHPDNQI